MNRYRVALVVAISLIAGGTGNVLSIAVSSDGTMLATGSLECENGTSYSAV